MTNDIDAIRRLAGQATGTPRATVDSLCNEVEELRAALTQSRKQAATYADEIGSLKAELERLRTDLRRAENGLALADSGRIVLVGEVERLRAEGASKDAVVEAAKAWRVTDDEAPGFTEIENALVDAVDALPKAATV